MKKITVTLFLMLALLLCGCGDGSVGVKYTSGQCVNCDVITEKAVEYQGMIFCESCYHEALPTICDLCGQNADGGEDYNGILYCAGCFDEYCDENDLHQCANCNEFKTECVDRGAEGMPAWICKDCNASDKFDGDDVAEQIN